MGCTDDLSAEHAAVLTSLGILGAIGGRLESGRSVAEGDLREMLEFLGVFVDMCHHTKEERHLFPAVREAGNDADRAAIDRLSAEHERGRVLVRAMRDGVDRYAAGDPAAAGDLVEAIRSYDRLLRAHIRAEDGEFFPAAEARLSGEADLALVEAFESVERDVVGEGRHEAFHEMLHRQRDRYVGPPEHAGRGAGRG